MNAYSRNMDLVRLLLLRSEGDTEAARKCEEFSQRERAYHLQLMIDARLVEGFIQTDQNGEAAGAVVTRLTWEGHDFLDSVRDNQVWNKAKSTVMREGMSFTFDILKTWLNNELKSRLGFPP